MPPPVFVPSPGSGSTDRSNASWAERGSCDGSDSEESETVGTFKNDSSGVGCSSILVKRMWLNVAFGEGWGHGLESAGVKPQHLYIDLPSFVP